MRKRYELSNLDSCINQALDDELTFVLLGRDVAAPDIIRAWVRQRIQRGKNRSDDLQIVEALETAMKMEKEYPALRLALDTK